ncbi:MAG: alpha/beta hydrolase [Beijerinckiaceae bacterium]
MLVVLDRVREHIDYDETGTGSTIVLVPGSCSTGAAWRPVVAALKDRFRCVTTSLLGYGGTAERRTACDRSIAHEAEMVEWVVRRAGGRIHMVGHSFGGLVALAVALRNGVDLASLTVLEPPAIELLRERSEHRHYETIRRMADIYFRAFKSGNEEAIAIMVDFYGGDGTFASWPAKVRAYAVQTTRVNILDWASAYGFALSAASLGTIEVPTLLVHGGASHPAMQAINALLNECVISATAANIEGATHFMLTSHANEVAGLIAQHVRRAERKRELTFGPLKRAYLSSPPKTAPPAADRPTPTG